MTTIPQTAFNAAGKPATSRADVASAIDVETARAKAVEAILIAPRDLSESFVTASSGATPRSLAARFGDVKNALDHQITGNGITDETNALGALLAAGGYVYFPAGNYLIAAAGPAAGGCYVNLTKPLHVVCDPQAKFFTNGLDHNMISLWVPSNGSGLPSTGKIDVTWEGGFFDMTQVKNSTTYPFIPEYPSSNPGVSNTTDGISIAGGWLDGSGNYQSGIANVRLTGIRFYSGAHWLTGGGDSHIIASGCDNLYIDCWHQGSRDTAVYSSRDGNSGTQGQNFTIRGTYINCFFGMAFKRSVVHMESDGYYVNCVGGVEINWGIGPRPISANVTGTFINCQRAVRSDWGLGINIHGCTVLNMGATLADGVTTLNPNVGSPTGILFRSNYAGRIHDNTFVGFNPVYAKSTTQGIVLDALTTGGSPVGATLQTTYCDVSNNFVDGLHFIGQEVSPNADFNRWNRNRSINCEVDHVVTSGANSSEIRYNETYFTENYTRGLLVGDGSTSQAALGRAADPTTGIVFGTGSLTLQAGGSPALTATSAAVTSTKVFYTPAGNVATPIYSFTAEPGLGAYRSATGHYSIASGGNMVFDASPAAVAIASTAFTWNGAQLATQTYADSAGGLSFNVIGGSKIQTGRAYAAPATVATATTTADYVVYTPFPLISAATLVSLCVRATGSATSGNVRLGVYSDVNGKPGTLIASGTAVYTASGAATLAVTLNTALTKGIYWLAAQTDAAIAMTCMANGVGLANGIIGSNSAIGAINMTRESWASADPYSGGMLATPTIVSDDGGNNQPIIAALF